MSPSTMRAAVVHAFKEPLKLETVPVPRPSSKQILVRVHYCGVCHTDLHAAHGDWPVKPSPPFIPGHEGVGVVEEVGDDVHHIKVGDRVGMPWLHTACGHCEYCVDTWETLCPEQQNTGYSVNGSFADYVLADPDYVAVIPDGLDLAEAAPILCAGVTVYKGIKETDTKAGDWMVVSGVGGLGHLAVQYARAMGMRVIGLDVSDEKCELAKKVGAEHAFNVRDSNVLEQIRDATGGGAHGVLVTAVSQSAFSLGVDALRRGGTVSLVGLPPGTFELPIFDVVLTRKTVRGSIVGTRNDLVESLGFAARGQVRSHVRLEPLESINDVFGQMIDGEIEGRVVLDMGA
jgi:propanol-preferring alcohol dehydrogenase